jgi:NADH-quinone oxidoreductase subunit A
VAEQRRLAASRRGGTNIADVEQYLPILLLLVLVALFAGGSVTASRLLSPKRPTGAKEGPYESGIATRYRPAARFPVRFYLVAMIFIIFDIEVVFLYPWAVMYHQLWTFGLAEMAVFAVIVFVAFSYMVSNGALDWGPRQKKGARATDQLTPSTTSTVRRVPRPQELPYGVAPMPLEEEPASGEPEAQPARSA